MPSFPHTPIAGLRLPWASLQAALQAALQTSAPDTAPPAATPATLLAHAGLALPAAAEAQAAHASPTWLHAGPLQLGPPRPLPPQRHADPNAQPASAVLLLAVAPAETPPPTAPTQAPNPAACTAWLQAHAPGWRQACAGPNPLLVLLWLRLDGLGLLLAHRAGEAGCWPLPALELTGARTQRLLLGPAATAPARPPAPVSAEPEVEPSPRYAPQRAALGPAQQHLHLARVLLVGAGRIGSVLAHGLLRMGVQHLGVVEPDVMEPHNEDGDLAPLPTGSPKLQALARFVRGVARPGATLALHPWPVARKAVGPLVALANLLVVCTDNDAARLWADAWALATQRDRLVIATGIQPDGAQAELRLLPAGTGCLACVGGYAQAHDLLQQLAQPLPPATPADVRQQRMGSLRSWSALAAHAGLRLIEQHLAQPSPQALFRHLAETEDGSLQVRDAWHAPDLGHGGAAFPGRHPRPPCPFCHSLLGAGTEGVSAPRLRALTQQWLAQREAGAA
ncbi:ThiF family adenylyltransferase [Ideonella sp. 4Y16]|uniref:ThiF family adenylyltransferase n=1 Tax=Ideonella alba TaxID=2824118 RepID=UPI001B396E01|nr:ThiF family adenylyltransferase [Ideonella alba]MBQ0942257.1 ThiF family adenylyltransferase [Ideonella alba]